MSVRFCKDEILAVDVGRVKCRSEGFLVVYMGFDSNPRLRFRCVGLWFIGVRILG